MVKITWVIKACFLKKEFFITFLFIVTQLGGKLQRSKATATKIWFIVSDSWSFKTSDVSFSYYFSTLMTFLFLPELQFLFSKASSCWMTRFQSRKYYILNITYLVFEFSISVLSSTSSSFYILSLQASNFFTSF